MVLLALSFWAGSSDVPPPARMGTKSQPQPPSPGIPAAPDEADLASVARRAEIAAEEARLAALRDTRLRLQQELEALREAAEEVQRDPVLTMLDGPRSRLATIAAAPAGIVLRPIRAVVLHRAESASAAAAASAIADALRGGGVEVQALRGASFVPSTPVVRYFHDEDRAAATWLAAQLGHGWAVQDFRAFRPQPAPQTLEVWLPAS